MIRMGSYIRATLIKRRDMALVSMFVVSLVVSTQALVRLLSKYTENQLVAIPYAAASVKQGAIVPTIAGAMLTVFFRREASQIFWR